MQELSTFRHLVLEVSCPVEGYEQTVDLPTTRDDGFATGYGLQVAATICGNPSWDHLDQHRVTITERPATVARA